MYDDIESRAKYAESIYVDLNKIIMSEESDYKNSLNRNLIEVGEYKSILKKSRSGELDEDTKKYLKYVIRSIVMGTYIPIGLVDLYFGYTDKSCVDDYNTKSYVKINLKQYLLVAGYASLSYIVLVIGVICALTCKNECNLASLIIDSNIIGLITTAFSITWTIIGSIIYWGYVYKPNTCNNYVNSYLFISLIIKLLISIKEIVSQFYYRY
jgi:hypothetical protein